MTDPERQVAAFLKELNLWWRYEFPVFVHDEKERPRVWTPDFYVPKLGIYIEVCGARQFDYEYRKGIYESNELNVVFIHYYKDSKKWKSYLVNRIREIEEKRCNDVKNMFDLFST